MFKGIATRLLQNEKTKIYRAEAAAVWENHTAKIGGGEGETPEKAFEALAIFLAETCVYLAQEMGEAARKNAADNLLSGNAIFH